MSIETTNNEIRQPALVLVGDLVLVQFPDGTVKACASLDEAELEFDLFDERERYGNTATTS